VKNLYTNSGQTKIEGGGGGGILVTIKVCAVVRVLNPLYLQSLQVSNKHLLTGPDSI